MRAMNAAHFSGAVVLHLMVSFMNLLSLRDAVDLVQVVGRGYPLTCLDVGLDLFGLGGAGNDGGDLGFGSEATDRDMQERETAFLRERFEGLDLVEVLVGEVSVTGALIAGESC